MKQVPFFACAKKGITSAGKDINIAADSKTGNMPKLSSSQIRAIACANKAMTVVGYAAYPLLLILLYFFDRELLAQDIIVPASGFFAVTIVRYLVNAPRPYENGGPAPLIDKRTQGRSFPSRHAFCMFMIALTWLDWDAAAWVGAVLLICAAILAACRVLLRVHYPKDVICATLLAILFAVLGYWVL